MLDPKKMVSEIALGILEESSNLEFKAHLGCPDIERFIFTDKNGHKRYRLNKGKDVFKDDKQLQQYFRFHCLIRPVAAFLNASGGCLVFGFNDYKNEDGTRSAIGLINEKPTDEDSFSLAVSDALETKIGRVVVKQFTSLHFQQVGNKRVCLLEVRPYTGPGHAIFINSYETLDDSRPQSLLFTRINNSSRAITATEEIFQFGWSKGFEHKDKREVASGGNQPVIQPTPARGGTAQNPEASRHNFNWKGPYEIIDWAQIRESVVLLLPTMKPVKCKIGNTDDLIYRLSYLETEDVFIRSTSGYSVEDGWFIDIKSGKKLADRHQGIDIDPNFDHFGLKLNIINEVICPPRTVRSYWDIPIIKFTTNRGDYFSLPNGVEMLPMGQAKRVSGWPKQFEDLNFLQHSERE